jgi:hypothetical protein
VQLVCQVAAVPKTQSERIADTINFFPTTSNTPTLTATNAAIAAAKALQAAMASSNPPVPTATMEPAKEALKLLSKLFQGATSASKPSDVTTDEPPARIAQPGPLLRVAERPLLPRVEEHPIAARTQAANPTEAIEEVVENYFMNAVMHLMSGKPMTYSKLITDQLTRLDWELSAANEFGCLAQGVRGRIKGTNTIRFIDHADMLKD